MTKKLYEIVAYMRWISFTSILYDSWIYGAQPNHILKKSIDPKIKVELHLVYENISHKTSSKENVTP